MRTILTDNVSAPAQTPTSAIGALRGDGLRSRREGARGTLRVAGCASLAMALTMGAAADEARAAPIINGAPRYATDREGGAVADYGSYYAVKAEVSSPAADMLGSLTFYDARPSAVRETPLGTLSLTLLEGGNPALSPGRQITFHSWGWEEKAAGGSLSASVSVVTLAQNVFGLVIKVGGAMTPLTLEARMNGEIKDAAGVTLKTEGGSVLATVDNGEARPFGVALSATKPLGNVQSMGGATYNAAASVDMPADGVVGLVLAFHNEPGAAPALAGAVLSEKGAPEGWLGPIVESWGSHLKEYPAAHDTESEYLKVDESSIAVLRMNQVGPFGPETPASVFPSKTHYNNFWVWDTAFQVLATSELSSARAFEELEVIYRAQVDDPADPDYGMIPNHVNEQGEPPSGVGSIAPYSQAPAFGVAVREVYDRSSRDDEARARLARSYDVGRLFVDWWIRRRDWDNDGLIESNGGWENGMDDSPRFSEPPGWLGVLGRIPATGPADRNPVNCVDTTAWVYRYYVELASVARILGKDDEARDLDAKAREIAKKLDEAFWDESRGAYFDYYYDENGKKTFLRSRTPVSWWPLYVGATRDPSRVARVTEQILDPTSFWGSHGIPSVAFNDPAYNAGGYWSGPMWINVTYATMVALFRYGFEEEADELRRAMLDTAALGDGIWERYNSQTGEGIGTYQFGWSGALLIEALRNRHQSEISTTSRGGPAPSRQGYLRHVRRTSDGAPLLEIETEGGYEVPLTTIASPTAIFGDEPVTISFADPRSQVGDRKVALNMPYYQSATLTVQHSDGSKEEYSLDRSRGALRVTAILSDVVTISNFVDPPTTGPKDLTSGEGCGCRLRPKGAGGDAGAPSLLLVGAALLQARRARGRGGRSR